MNVETLMRKSVEMRRRSKNYLSNAFYNIQQWKELEDRNVLGVYEGEKSIWVSIREKDVYRIVFFTESVEDIGAMDFSIFNGYDMPVVLEFLDKKNNIDKLQAIIEKKQFIRTKGLQRMYCTNMNCGEAQLMEEGYSIQVAQKENGKEIYDILYKIFDIRVSRLPDMGQILKDIEERHVFVVKEQKRIAGVAYFQRQGAKVEYLYQLALLEQYRGKNLVYLLLNYAVKKLGEDKQYSVWVETDNVKGIHVYQKIGFQEDGLKEYVFQYIEKGE